MRLLKNANAPRSTQNRMCAFTYHTHLIYVCMRVRIYAYTYTYIYIYIYMHVHAKTFIYNFRSADGLF